MLVISSATLPNRVGEFRTVRHQRLCAEGLERYGFVKSGLSTALNGTLQINEDWVNSEVNSSGIDHCVETVLN